MKKVLYFSNIEVPYRARVFNELSKKCDLTVLYERKRAKIRNENWTKSVESNYNIEYLGGLKVKKENSFSLKVFKYVFKKYDSVIIGCYNSPSQMLAILLFRLLRKNYILNIDGEVFIEGKGIKNRIKRFFLSGASAYLAAGEKCAQSIRKISKDKQIVPYYFSSLTENELENNRNAVCERNGKVLVVGQYLYVKGLDVALNAARMDSDIQYKFIGMGDRTEEFISTYNADAISNIEFIPFLKKEDLEKEYKTCSLFVLPSRQECWGLVINEAASFGTPIVSTYGSGAAVEFLSDDFPQYLAIPDDSNDLHKCIKSALKSDKTEDYQAFLTEKSKMYSIEHGVSAICKVCNI